MPSTRVFLCHSSTDKPFVDRLAFDLERVNVGVWYDKWEIKVGDSILEKIQHGLSSQDYLALVLSPHSVESPWVKKEINAALIRELDEKRVVILPVLIENCAIPLLLRDKKWADFRKSYEEGLEELLMTLSPTTPQAIRRSREFRVVQYLVSGLAASDQNGVNTLTARQLTVVYPFRKGLSAYLSPEEKRLLFWSAAAFRHANPQTQLYTDIAVPVWGLNEGMSVEQQAAWILEGLSGVLFDYLVPYYRWAARIAQLQDADHLKRSFVWREELHSNIPLVSKAIPPQAMLHFLIAMAEGGGEIFHAHFLPNMDQGRPNAHLVVEASSYLSPALHDEFYLKLIKGGGLLGISAVMSLARLKRESAVQGLREYLDVANRLGPPELDQGFRALAQPDFTSSLRDWFDHEPNIERSGRLVTILAWLGQATSGEIVSAFDQARAKGCYGLMPSLVRAYGRTSDCSIDILRKWLDGENPILCEAAIFAGTYALGQEMIERILPLLKSSSDVVVAAAMESLVKIQGSNAQEVIRNYVSHDSCLVRAAYFRALAYTRPSNYADCIDLVRAEPILVRIAAYRSLVQIATRPELHEWLDSTKSDVLLRLTIDEYIYAPRQFAPKWIKFPEQFNEEDGRLPTRITNFDPPDTWLFTGFDLDRLVRFHLQKSRDA